MLRTAIDDISSHTQNSKNNSQFGEPISFFKWAKVQLIQFHLTFKPDLDIKLIIYIYIIKQISLSMTFGLDVKPQELYRVDCILSDECPQTEDACLWAHKMYIYQSKQPKKQIFSGASEFHCRYNSYASLSTLTYFSSAAIDFSFKMCQIFASVAFVMWRISST